MMCWSPHSVVFRLSTSSCSCLTHQHNRHKATRSTLMIQIAGAVCGTGVTGFQTASVLQNVFLSDDLYNYPQDRRVKMYVLLLRNWSGRGKTVDKLLLSARWHKCSVTLFHILWRHTPLMWISANLPPAVTRLVGTWPSRLSSWFVSADPCHDSDIQRIYGTGLWQAGIPIWPDGKQAAQDAERRSLSSQAKTVGTVLDISRTLCRSSPAWKKMHGLFCDSQSK